MSELIHNSAENPNCQEAYVSVHFEDIIDNDNGDNGFKTVPGTALVVKRLVKKDNTSRYYINDSASNWTQVTNTLKQRGIDLVHNRFLILQVGLYLSILLYCGFILLH